MQPDDDEFEPEAEPISAADTPDWLSAMQPDDDEFEPEAEPLAAVDQPDWLSSMNIGEESSAEVEPVNAIQDDTPDWLSALQADDEPEAETAASNDDWQPASGDDVIARVTADPMPDWLTEMPVAEANADEPLSDDEWNDADDLEPETANDVPDWLSAVQNKQPADEQPTETYDWDDNAPLEESMPAAPAPASNAPDWLNAMVPGLDVDYDAPEDEPVETEFLPTARQEAIAAEKAAKDAKVRPEFGWLLDIVSEESQQVTVVADKTALRRFVFSRLPTWLRKPTEQPDKPASDSEADNVDIPPWLQ